MLVFSKKGKELAEQLCYTQGGLTSFSFPWIQAVDLHDSSNDSRRLASVLYIMALPESFGSAVGFALLFHLSDHSSCQLGQLLIDGLLLLSLQLVVGNCILFHIVLKDVLSIHFCKLAEIPG